MPVQQVERDENKVARIMKVGAILEIKDVRRVYQRLVETNYEYESNIDIKNRSTDAVRKSAEEKAGRAADTAQRLEEELSKEVNRAAEKMVPKLDGKELEGVKKAIKEHAKKEAVGRLQKERNPTQEAATGLSPKCLAAVPPLVNTTERG